MGNDTSVLSEYRISEECYAQAGLWNLHTASRLNDGGEIFTAFCAKLPSHGQASEEFECAVERLKTLRHPTILKYMNSCISGEYIYLFVEYVLPLNQLLPKLTELDICSGLHNVLLAIDFLHSRAGIVHNNVCKDAIFVGKNGEWKLGYFDVSSKFSEVTRSFVEKVHSFRYGKCIPPEDDTSTPLEAKFVCQRDMFSYGVLVEETISICITSGMANAIAFLDHTSKMLENKDPQMRGTARVLLEHPFFKQPLLYIQDFLSEIPIKDYQTREDFFRQLPSMLYSIPESIVGSKLANILLSRIVVLNPVAQQYLLPHVLIPRSETTPGLFDATNYKLFILPVVSRIFLVRDAQIRLILLQYFSHYVELMDKEHLAQFILPELLLGIKDTNDIVVASTLRALADLVPILGSETVIGGTRLKLFTHGVPKSSDDASMPLIHTPEKESQQEHLNITPPPVRQIALPERHEPDGGEDATSPEKSDDNWSDWEAGEDEDAVEQTDIQAQFPIPVSETPTSLDKTFIRAPTTEEPSPEAPKAEIDLATFEIRVKPVEDEIDYFADMQPTITSAPSTLITPKQAIDKSSGPSLNFNVQSVDEEENDIDGWNWDD